MDTHAGEIIARLGDEAPKFKFNISTNPTAVTTGGASQPKATTTPEPSLTELRDTIKQTSTLIVDAVKSLKPEPKLTMTEQILKARGVNTLGELNKLHEANGMKGMSGHEISIERI